MNRPRETCPEQAVLHAGITCLEWRARCPPISFLYRRTPDLSTPILARLLKTAHLQRWPASPLAAAYFQYASLGRQRAALHLGPFEQPG